MTGFEFLALATIGFAAVGEAINLAVEHGPALIEQVKGWI
mgnify:CR=1 FL=1